MDSEEALRIARHDFKSPLTVLRIAAELLRSRPEDPERVRRAADRILAQIDRLDRLADELFDVSMAASGHLRISPERCDLRPIVEEVAATFEDRVAAVKLPERHVWGNWDRKRLKRALAAILSCAESVTLAVVPGEAAVRIIVHGEFRRGARGAAVFIARAVIERHGGELREAELGDVDVTLPVSA